MNEISITKTIYEYFDDIGDTEIRQNIINYMQKYNIGNKGISTITKHKLKFKIKNRFDITSKYKNHDMRGGETYEIELKDGKTYYYNINNIEPISKTKYKMMFMTFDDINECACLTFGKKDSKNTVLRIDGIKTFDECILCKDKKHKFKSGDILMQIILELVKNNSEFSHIDKIELADASQKKCYDISLKLIYLRTMTHGIPYYAKYGFRPILKTDYKDVFVYNRNNFKLNKTMTRDEILSIIKKNKIDINESTYKSYNKYIKKHIFNNKNINPVIFISQTIKIVDNSISENKNNSIKIIDDKDELVGLCDFIRKIYIDIYNFLGYKNYNENLWQLKIERNAKK